MSMSRWQSGSEDASLAYARQLQAEYDRSYAESENHYQVALQQQQPNHPPVQRRPVPSRGRSNGHYSSDEEYARQLQAHVNAGRVSAPNILSDEEYARLVQMEED